MTTERGSGAARSRPRGAISVTHVQYIALVTLLADVFYRIAIRAHVRRAIGI